MSQILFEYPYSAFATGILNTDQFINELSAMLDRDPSQGEQAWVQIEALYKEISLKRVERDQLFKLIHHLTGFSKPAAELAESVSDNPAKTPAKSIKASLANDLHNATSTNSSQSNATKKTSPIKAAKPTVIRQATVSTLNQKSSEPGNKASTEQTAISSMPPQEATVIFNTRQAGSLQTSLTNHSIPQEQSLEPATLIHQHAVQHAVAEPPAPADNPAQAATSQSETTLATKPMDGSTNSQQQSQQQEHNQRSVPIQPSAWQSGLRFITDIPWHIVFPVTLLSGFVTVLVLQLMHIPSDNMQTAITSSTATIDKNTTSLIAAKIASKDAQYTNTTSSIPPLNATASGQVNLTPDAITQDNADHIANTQTIEALHHALMQAIDNQTIDPLTQANSALAILETMILSDASHALTRQGKMAVAQTYLQLAKQARQNDEWEQAGRYVDQAIHIRKANTLPSGFEHQP